MSEMAELQVRFQDYLLNSDDSIYQHIMSTAKVPADVRLAIYGNAYRARLIEALQDSYSVLHGYLGDDAFAELALAYLEVHPSTFRSIRWFGDQLPAFLTEHAHYQQYPYLAELAQLEWGMTLAFDAADTFLVALDQMTAIPPEAWPTLRFKAHPSVQLIQLGWNVVEIWQSISNDEVIVEPVKSEDVTHWLIWRHDLVTHYHSLTPDEAYAIDAMLNDVTFGDICAGLCNWCDEQDAAMRAAMLLKGWICSGLISELKGYDDAMEKHG